MYKNNFFMVKKEAESGKFYGYASVFNTEDSQGDIILNGAFHRTLKNNNENIKLLLQHDRNSIIGETILLREDVVGLYVEGRIYLEKQLGWNTFCFTKNNLLSGLSIGYRVNDFNHDAKGRRVIKSLDLFEISIVSSPANRFSRIIYCKSK
ncbi:hypothetical protein FACS1894152_1920 [Bacilli bacterium]|nr:hypothetical protein FACS1894152_1920 [Bacilli bacterium]